MPSSTPTLTDSNCLSQILGPFLDSITSSLPSTLVQVSGFSSNVPNSSTYSLVSITSVSSLDLHGIDITDPGYEPEPAYMTEPSWLTQKIGTGGLPLPDTAVPLSFKTSTVTNFSQCTASQSSYNAALSLFTNSVNSAVQAGAYSQSIWTSAYVLTNVIPAYSFSLATVTNDVTYSHQLSPSEWVIESLVDTETYSYAWTTVWATSIQTLPPNTFTIIDTPTFSGAYPTCVYVEFPCGGCTIAAASLQLIYWPVSTAEGNPSSTISWNGITPRVGFFSGTPFTSGSVYLNYAAVSAINSCGVLSGGLRAGRIITLASDEVSSVIGDGTDFTEAQSFNYANLNYPYAWRAYNDALGDCYPSGSRCQFEIAGGYNPYVSLPQQLRDLDPAWAKCTIAPNAGSWDPPYALQPIEGTLTPPIPVYTQGPMAGATPVSPMAQSTLVSASITTAVDGLPQPKPWTPVSASEPTPAKSPLTGSPNVDPSVSADPSASVDPPPESPSPLPSPQQTPSDSPPTDPTTAQQPTPAPVPQPQPTSPPIITFQGTPITADTTTGYTIGAQTLVPGGPAIIISSTTLSLAPSATALAIGDATIHFQPPSPSTPAMITISNTAYTANSASAFILGTQTLVPGGPAITNARTVLSLAPSATAIVIGDVTIPLQPPTSLAPRITIGPSIYAASPSTYFLIGTQTLQPGGPAPTISGTIISLFPSATALLLAGSTIPLPPALPTALPTIFTIGTATYTATSNTAGDLVIGTQTLFPGGAITVAGTVLSLEAAGTVVVVGGTKTVPVAGGVVTAAATQTAGVGGVVASVLGGGLTGLGGVVVSEYGATPTKRMGVEGGMRPGGRAGVGEVGLWVGRWGGVGDGDGDGDGGLLGWEEGWGWGWLWVWVWVGVGCESGWQGGRGGGMFESVRRGEGVVGTERERYRDEAWEACRRLITRGEMGDTTQPAACRSARFNNGEGTKNAEAQTSETGIT
ncbi:hypothetical protein MMC17_006645 [Xylographa soralifera]|nr:hypothetical protein [Xylographa soralifera]